MHFGKGLLLTSGRGWAKQQRDQGIKRADATDPFLSDLASCQASACDTIDATSHVFDTLPSLHDDTDTSSDESSQDLHPQKRSRSPQKQVGN